jgi:hypothetical protein
MGSLEAYDIGMFLKNAVNDPSECSGPFAVDDSDMIDSLAAALSEVFRHQVLHIFRAERMKIQYSINRDFYRIIVSHFLISIKVMQQDRPVQEREIDENQCLWCIFF